MLYWLHQSHGVVKEKDVKTKLAKELKRKFQHVYKDIQVDVNIKHLSKKLEQILDPLPAPKLQPDIDLLFTHVNNMVTVTEVKYFRPKRRSLNLSYYEGLSQALALLQYGFDAVSLMYIFDYKIFLSRTKHEKEQILQQYGGHAWRFIRKMVDRKRRAFGRLGVGLDFTCVIYDPRFKKPRGSEFQVVPMNWRRQTLKIQNLKPGYLCPLKDWKYRNPFVINNDRTAKKIRDLILADLSKNKKNHKMKNKHRRSKQNRS